jgi:nitrogen fixation/metabolism regulation signal transduction histidine kinase
MHVLIEAGPVAIVTVDERGIIELAYPAAVEFLAPHNRHLIGCSVAGFLPPLHHAFVAGRRSATPDVDPVTRRSRQREVLSGEGVVFRF